MTGPFARPLRFVKRHIKELAQGTGGTTAVEFALIAVPFLGLLLAIMEAGLVAFNTEALEAAVQQASRTILTGTAQTAGISSASQFVSTYLCPSSGRILPSYIDCSTLIVDVRPASTFASATTSDTFYQNASSQEFCPGGPNTIVVVRVAYPMPVFLPLFSQATAGMISVITAGLVNDVPGNSGYKHLLVATVAFENEPFSGTAYTAPSGC